MTGYLTTHVLDTTRGCPAAGVKIDFYRLDGDTRTLLARVTTNADGRVDSPLLPDTDFATGTYELLFHAGAYQKTATTDTLPHTFLDQIPIRFNITTKTHHHIPLLLSIHAYTTYKGS